MHQTVKSDCIPHLSYNLRRFPCGFHKSFLLYNPHQFINSVALFGYGSIEGWVGYGIKSVHMEWELRTDRGVKVVVVNTRMSSKICIYNPCKLWLHFYRPYCRLSNNVTCIKSVEHQWKISGNWKNFNL